MNSFPEKITRRLLLRRLETNDANAIFKLRSDEEVNRYLDRTKAETVEDALTFISKINQAITDNKSMYWAITDKWTKVLLGTICIWNNSVEEKKAEIGYELLPEYQGKGLMQEAIEVVLDYAFNEMKLNVVLAVFHPQNQASVRLLERNNFILNTDSEDMVENMSVYRLEKYNYNV